MFGAMTLQEGLELTHHALRRAGVPEGHLVVVAASGGCDSTVLLHLVRALHHPVVVAHVDHGMRGEESDGDRLWLQALCERESLELEVMHLDASKAKTGPLGFQGEARNMRMAWLERIRHSHQAAAILLGHHGDDQAETWLLHAMRSLEPLSIRGMALKEGHVVRPLLGMRKANILDLAKSQGWSWREDSSNSTLAYTRNRIRHEVLPLLDAIRPGTSDHFVALAERSQAEYSALTTLLAEAREQAELVPGQWSVEGLQRNPVAAIAFRHSLKAKGWSDAQAEQALQLLRAQVGAKVEHLGVVVLRERNCIQELNPAHTDSKGQPQHHATIDSVKPGSLPQGDLELHWQPASFPDNLSLRTLNQCWIPHSWLPVRCRNWVPGDRLQPLGMEGRSKVSDILTQAQIPNSQRSEIKVLERMSDGRLLWVAGHKLSEQARLNLDQFAAEPGLEFTLQTNE